jgi:hypothetical protein
MTNIINLFKFIEKTRPDYKVPTKLQLKLNPDFLSTVTSVNDNVDFSLYHKIKDLGKLQKIGGDAYFGDSQITDLGNLKSIGGDAYFDDSQITDLGNLKSIGGDAYFGGSQITDLGNLKSIRGDAYFRGSQITDLGNLQTIGGRADFGDRKDLEAKWKKRQNK